MLAEDPLIVSLAAVATVVRPHRLAFDESQEDP